MEKLKKKKKRSHQEDLFLRDIENVVCIYWIEVQTENHTCQSFIYSLIMSHNFLAWQRLYAYFIFEAIVC